MKIVLLASSHSTHTIRWANALVEKSQKVYLFSQHKLRGKLNKEVVYRELKYQGRLGYFLNSKSLSKALQKIRPDIVHAHFASGYGTLASNLGCKYILSIWGSDVYDFPSNPINKFLLKRSLHNAYALFSTSMCMKEESKKYTQKNIEVVPFGVDTELFRMKDYSVVGRQEIVIGTVKVLEYKYGIDVLIKAFSMLCDKFPSQNFVLEIIGDGSLKKDLQILAFSLGVEHSVKFRGWVDNQELPRLLRNLDIFVVSSRLDSESFGVAAVEAGAVGLPSIVTDVGGLPEVVVDGETGTVVKRNSPKDMSLAMEQLSFNRDKRIAMGTAARSRVSKCYDWTSNVDLMCEYYEHLSDECQCG